MLLINWIGGLKTLSSELRPFSHGRDVANWIEGNRLSDALIIGSTDYAVSTVAGYLRRPIYYLECECRATYVVWSKRRRTLTPMNSCFGLYVPLIYLAKMKRFLFSIANLANNKGRPRQGLYSKCWQILMAQ